MKSALPLKWLPQRGFVSAAARDIAPRPYFFLCTEKTSRFRKAPRSRHLFKAIKR
jgi:hypothetical protein